MRTKKIMQSLAVMLLLVLAGCKETSQSYPVDLNSSLDTDRPSLQTGQNERLSQMKTNQADCLMVRSKRPFRRTRRIFPTSIQRRCSESMRYIRAICPKEVLFLSVRSIMWSKPKGKMCSSITAIICPVKWERNTSFSWWIAQIEAIRKNRAIL